MQESVFEERERENCERYIMRKRSMSEKRKKLKNSFFFFLFKLYP